MIYSTSSRDVQWQRSLHVPHFTCHTGSGWQGLTYGSEGVQMGSPALGVFTLSWHFTSPRATLFLFIIWKLNKR